MGFTILGLWDMFVDISRLLYFSDLRVCEGMRLWYLRPGSLKAVSAIGYHVMIGSGTKTLPIEIKLIARCPDSLDISCFR
jgi:hypothetical protein